MHTVHEKPPPLTATLASTLEALRAVGDEISLSTLARRLGKSRSIVADHLLWLERDGFVTSCLRGRERVYAIRKEREAAVKEQWEYDPATWTITTSDATGKRYLRAARVRPQHAAIIFGLIGVARRAAEDPRLNPSPCREQRCQCLACEARRLLEAIGGEP